MKYVDDDFFNNFFQNLWDKGECFEQLFGLSTTLNTSTTQKQVVQNYFQFLSRQGCRCVNKIFKNVNIFW